MAIPHKNGVNAIVEVCKIIVRIAATYSRLWGGFLSAEDHARLTTLVTCAEGILNELDRSEYRP